MKLLEFKSGIVGILLRLLTLISKFILVVHLAKYLSPEEMGVYGVFVATVGYALYFLGLDFYAYASREMLALDKSEWAFVIRDQVVFYVIVYLVVLPFLVLVFFAGLLKWEDIAWFYLILSIEHLSQESYRLLVVIHRANFANLVLLLRGGAWVYVVVGLMYSDDSYRQLDTVWSGWFIGAVLSMLLTARILYKDLDWCGVRGRSIDWYWIRRGLKNALLFFAGTLALRGIFIADKYFLKINIGDAAVGVYVFFMGMSSAILSFIEAGVVAQQYPKIVAAYNRGEYSEYKSKMKRMAKEILFAVVVLSIGAIGLIYPVLEFVGKSIYWQKIEIYWVLVVFNCAMCFGHIAYFPLYVRRLDVKILISNYVGLLCVLVSLVVLTPKLAALGVALSMVLSMVSISLTQTVFIFYERSNSKSSILAR